MRVLLFALTITVALGCNATVNQGASDASGSGDANGSDDAISCKFMCGGQCACEVAAGAGRIAGCTMTMAPGGSCGCPDICNLYDTAGNLTGRLGCVDEIWTNCSSDAERDGGDGGRE